MLTSLRLAYQLKLLYALYSSGIPLGRVDAWRNTRALPKVPLPVSGGASNAAPVRIRAETRISRPLDEEAALQGCRRMYKDVVKVVRPKRSDLIRNSIFGRRYWTMIHAYGCP